MSLAKFRVLRRRLALTVLAILGLAPLLGVLGEVQPALADSFALDPNMSQVWQRTDLPVANGVAPRSWIWGPQAFDIRQEDYADAPGGKRLVAYFDKSRMEINNPAGDRSSQWFVTNGLLVKELISGQEQVGDNKTVAYLPAEVSVAGDLSYSINSPTYASLYSVATLAPGLNAAPDRTNLAVTSTINRDGKVGEDLRFTDKVKNSYYDPNLHHNIPNVFWNYFQQRGLVQEGNSAVQGQIFDWTFAVGLPLTEPYWARVSVNGTEKDVLLQAFERRVLTYTPDNDPAWQVEMGNVGLHYYQWRNTISQTPNCPVTPQRGFGKLWADNYSVRVRLGCTYSGAESAVQVISQQFEHGKMLRVDSSSAKDFYQFWKQTIYILFEDGSFATAQDNWDPSQPANAGLTPPPGKYEPQKGLGKVWRNDTGNQVRERLGWATAPELSANGAAQNFSNGLMFWQDQIKQISVLYRYYSRTNIWEVYPDPFAG